MDGLYHVRELLMARRRRRYDVTQMASRGANLSARILSRVEEHGWGEDIALREGERAWSYDELAEQVRRVATVLRTLRVGRGERVAILMRDSLEAAAAILGTVHIGAVAVPLSELARPLAVRNYLNDSGAAVAIVHEGLEPALDEIRAEVPGLREVLCLGARSAGERDFFAAVRAAAPAAEATAVEPTDTALLLYSAGVAAGEVRGVPHAHETPWLAFQSFAQSVLGMSAQDRVLSVVRMSSAYGLGTGLLFPLLAGGEAALMPDQPKSEALFSVIDVLKPTILFATPSVYSQLARDAGENGRDAPLSQLRVCMSGAEGMPPKLVPKVRDVLGAELRVGYGLTEAFQFVLTGIPDPARPGACGTPVEHVEARIVDGDGAVLGADEIGTLQLKGPTLLDKYWGADAPDPRVGDWFTTQDRFMRDAQGCYYHCGRADDLFKVGGKWVSPIEVERALVAHEAVWESAVIGVDDEDGLIKPLAFVVTNVGHESGPDLAKVLREYVKAELAPYKYPRWIEFVSALPRGPNGKLLRHKLRVSRKPRRAETAADTE